MESAIHDLVRELDKTGRPRRRAPARELFAELEVVDDLLLDPWFFKTEEEIAAIEDDPTAKIIEIKIQPPVGDCDYGTGFADSAWAF